MKSQTAAEVAAAVSLAREGWRPARGELLRRRDRRRGDGRQRGRGLALRDAPRQGPLRLRPQRGRGSGRSRSTAAPVYGVCVAEKGVFRFTITTRGAAGHASMPGVGDNALLKMAPLLRAHRPSADPASTSPTRRGSSWRRLELDGDGDPAAALERLRERDPALAGFVEPMLGGDARADA